MAGQIGRGHLGLRHPTRQHGQGQQYEKYLGLEFHHVILLLGIPPAPASWEKGPLHAGKTGPGVNRVPRKRENSSQQIGSKNQA